MSENKVNEVIVNNYYCSIDSEEKYKAKENISHLMEQLGKLEKDLYSDKQDGKIGEINKNISKIDEEYNSKYTSLNYSNINPNQNPSLGLNPYQYQANYIEFNKNKYEKNTKNNEESLDVLKEKVEFLKSLLEKFSKQKQGLDGIDLSDKKYTKINEKIIGYGNKENFYDLVVNMKNEKSGRYEKFEQLVEQGNSGDAYLLMFMDNKSFSSWEAGFEGLHKINSGKGENFDKNRDYLLFNIHPEKLINIGKESDIDKIKKDFKKLSNTDFSMYNTIYYNSSNDFKTKYLSNFEGLSEEQNNRMGGFKSNIQENIIRNFHIINGNDIFNNVDDFNKLLAELSNGTNIMNNIKTKVLGLNNYMDGDTLYNVENFIHLAKELGKKFNISISKLEDAFIKEKEISIEKLNLNNLNIFDNDTNNSIKFILKKGCKEGSECFSLDKKDDLNYKIQLILTLPKVSEYLNKKEISSDKKAKYIMDLLFSTIEQSKIETIDEINKVLDKENNKKLKNSLGEYVLKHGDTNKDIFDTDRVIWEVEDNFWKETQKSKEQGLKPRTKLQILDEKLKEIGLNKLSKEDFNLIRNQFITLLHLEEDKETLKELDKKIAKNPDFARILISGTDEERRKLFKEVEDAKQDNLDKKNIDKTNQENLKTNQEAFENVTLTKDESGKIISYNYKNQRLDLKELGEKEISDLENNPEKVKKLIDFKLFLEETGVGFLWQHREKLAIKMKEKGYVFDYMDANGIGDNEKDTQEQLNLLNFIGEKLGFEKTDNISDLKEIFKLKSKLSIFELNGEKYESNSSKNTFEQALEGKTYR